MTDSSTTARSDRPSILSCNSLRGSTSTCMPNPDLDVLIVVMDGTGDLRAENLTMRLAAGLVAWLPRGSSRSLAAGARGLAYISVHRRRPGMQIGLKPPATAMIPPWIDGRAILCGLTVRAAIPADSNGEATSPPPTTVSGHRTKARRGQCRTARPDAYRADNLARATAATSNPKSRNATS